MRIINAMFGKGLGGIEQAFLDYTRALEISGNKVIPVIQPGAKIEKLISGEAIKIRNFGNWDFFAASKIRKLILSEKPDAIIAHGGRAAALFRKAAKNICPVIGVAHNYSTARLMGMDGIFTITEDLRKKVIAEGMLEAKTFKIPNMINLPQHEPEKSGFRNPPIIGSMGRFVGKKGFDVFLNALAILKNKGVAFKAKLGGDGEEKENLITLAKNLGITDEIEFIGWVGDKAKFFKSIDIFCLPSLHEPFGIVLLEALTNKTPTITTDSEGPSEIVSNEKDAFVVKKNDAEQLSNALEKMIKNQEVAKKLAENGYKTVKQNYSTEVVAKQIHAALEQLTSRHTAI